MIKYKEMVVIKAKNVTIIRDKKVNMITLLDDKLKPVVT